MKLNEKILYYRKQGKLSQEELAEQVGVSRQAVSKWELGDATPEVDKLLGLARAFGVTTDELLNEEEPENCSVPQEAAPVPPPQAAPGSDLPGFLGRMVRRWGWLAGFYIAFQGVGLALAGGLMWYMLSHVFGIVFTHFKMGRLFINLAAAVLAAGILIVAAGLVLAGVLWFRRKEER